MQIHILVLNVNFIITLNDIKPIQNEQQNEQQSNKNRKIEKI